VSLAQYRQHLSSYLASKMGAVAPNLGALIGDVVAARLISHAGSLTNLAKSPASTIQILGAEKALFRALKTKGNTPKYGLIFHSSFIGRAAAKNKGRISRYLANKCAIAARIDSFSDKVTTRFGERLREQVEDRLKFYETGEAPKRNAEVMAEVLKELGDAGDEALGGADAAYSEAKGARKDKKRKDKKRKAEEDSEAEEEEAAAASSRRRSSSAGSAAEATPAVGGKRKARAAGLESVDSKRAAATPAADEDGEASGRKAKKEKKEKSSKKESKSSKKSRKDDSDDE
jgi:nucleolar protein 56